MQKEIELKKVFMKGLADQPNRNVIGLEIAVTNVVLGIPEVAFNVRAEHGIAAIGIGIALILAIANDAVATGRERLGEKEFR